MKPLKIKFVDRPPFPLGQSTPDTVQVYVDVWKDGVNVSIARQGFIVAYPVMHTIESRIRQIEGMTPKRGVLNALMNAEWQRFFNDLLQQDDSWAFVIPNVGVHSLS